MLFRYTVTSLLLLITDYRFLEEVGSYVDSTHRDKVLRSPNKNGWAVSAVS